MKKNFLKKMTLFGITSSMMVGLVPLSSFAAEIDGATSNDGVNVTIPTEINVKFNADGTNTIDNLGIVNNSKNKEIYVNSISLDGSENNWSLLDSKTDIKTLSKDSKKVQFYVNDNIIEPNGEYKGLINFENKYSTIDSGDSGSLKFSINRGAFTKDIDAQKMFDMTINFGYSEKVRDINVIYTGTENSDSSQLPTSIKADAGSIELPNLTRPGHKFLGWTCATVSTPEKDFTYTVNGDEEALEFTANWSELTGTLKDSDSVNQAIPDSTSEIIFTDEEPRYDVEVTDLSNESNKSIVGWLDGSTYKISSQVEGNKIKATNANNLFDSKEKVELIDVSNLDTSSCDNFDCMFAVCRNLKEIKGLNKLSTANATSMWMMFGGCYKLENTDFSFATGNVSDMSEMFMNCKSIKTLDLSSFETACVTDMTEMFKGCESLEKIYVGSAFNTSNVDSADDAFLGCKVLIDSNDNVEYDNDRCIDYIHNGTYFTNK